MYYLGLAQGADFYGARFLKPGSAEIDEDVFADQLSHKRYTSEEDAFNAMAEKGIIKVAYDIDGNIASVIFDYTEFNYPYTDKLQYATYGKVTSLNTRKADAKIIEAVVNYIASGTTLTTTTDYRVEKINVGSVNTATDYKVNVYDGSALSGSGVYSVDNYNVESVNKPIVLVKQDRRGDYYLVDGVLAAADGNFDQINGQPRTLWHAVRNVATSGELTPGTQIRFSQFAKEDAKTLSIENLTQQNVPAMYVEATGAGTTPGTLLTKNVQGQYVTATSGDLPCAVWNGSKAVTTVYTTTTADASADGSIGAMNPSATYVLATENLESYTVTTANIKYLGAEITAARTVVVDDTYKTATSGNYDALAFVSIDTAGTYHLNVVDYKTAEIKVKDTGNNVYVKVTEANASTYFNNTYINSDTLVNGNLLSGYSATFGNVSGWSGLVKHNYDWVHYHKVDVAGPNNSSAYDQREWVAYEAYTLASPSTAVNFATSQKGTVSSASTPLYEAKETSNTSWNQITRFGKSGYITVVDVTDADFTATGSAYGQGATVVGSYEIKQQDEFALLQEYTLVIDEENIALVSSNDESNKTLDTFANNAGRYGWYELTDIPANNTDYYVMLTDKAGLDLTGIWSYSATQGTGLLKTAAGKDIECKAVQLEKKGNYYPAFETEEELIKAVYAITGLDTALVGTAKDTTKTTFKNWYDSVINATKSGIVNLEFSDPNAKSLFEELPTGGNNVVHGAEKCTYESTTEPKEVEVTYDASAVDTSKAGIYDITYTADVAEGAENATATVKVVVAPKYVRTWGANGKVATLTSFYVSNPEAKYAHYVYDWNAKKVTVTYYEVDGSVASTAVNSL